MCIRDSDGSLHERLTAEAAKLRPGESGLLALDWNNGNRTILVDQRLTGLLLGQTLRTSRAEIYRTLIEATAFGARAILERLEEYGVPVKTVVCAGGIAEKNPLLMQIYADATGREMRVARSAQACALGSAVAAAVMAGPAAGGHADFVLSLIHISFDLDCELTRWRQSLAAHEAITPERACELESHLRDSMAALRARDLSEEEAFWIAARRLGAAAPLSVQFAEADPAAAWRNRIFWMAVGLLVVQVAQTLLMVLGDVYKRQLFKVTEPKTEPVPLREVVVELMVMPPPAVTSKVPLTV